MEEDGYDTQQYLSTSMSHLVENWWIMQWQNGKITVKHVCKTPSKHHQSNTVHNSPLCCLGWVLFHVYQGKVKGLVCHSGHVRQFNKYSSWKVPPEIACFIYSLNFKGDLRRLYVLMNDWYDSLMADSSKCIFIVSLKVGCPHSRGTREGLPCICVWACVHACGIMVKCKYA